MKRFKNILCVVEPGAAANHALERAVDLAKSNQAGLTVVAVVEDVPPNLPLPESMQISNDLLSAILLAGKQALNDLIEPFQDRVKIQTKLLKGVVFLETIREVLRNGYDLVIKAPDNQDWLERLFGSTDLHLLRKCPCPVWIIKPIQRKTYQVVLAAVDTDTTHPENEVKSRQALNQQILKIAGSVALSEAAELHIVQAWHVAGEGMLRGSFMKTPQEHISLYIDQVKRQYATKLNELTKTLVADLGKEAKKELKLRTHLVKGFAAKEIPALARHIGTDLVVMGTVGRTGIPGFIVGNTAEMILSQINCSILAVKPPGFRTPVTLEK